MDDENDITKRGINLCSPLVRESLGLTSLGVSGGMTLRDYFAAHAPAEYLGVIALKVQEAGDDKTEVATIMSAAAFMYADAMLAERENP